MKSRLTYRLKALVAHLPLMAKDRLANWWHGSGEPRILITRHSGKRAYVFRDFLVWVRRELPELSSRIEFRRLPCAINDWSRFALHASWAGDSMDLWAPHSFARAMELQDECRRRGIGVVNPLDKLTNTAKLLGSELMRTAGVRTPRSIRITDPATFRENLGGLSCPILVREDRGHGQPALLLEKAADAESLDLRQFQAPIAAEFIDVRDPADGYYRKYRYVAAGELGICRHLLANDAWEVRPERRLTSAALRGEELAYVSQPDPNHALLQKARAALGLDVVGFDYSYDRQGRVVVWEANPFLNLNYPKNRAAAHIAAAVERSFAAIAHLYLQRAGLPIPQQLAALLNSFAAGFPERMAA